MEQDFGSTLAVAAGGAALRLEAPSEAGPILEVCAALGYRRVRTLKEDFFSENHLVEKCKIRSENFPISFRWFGRSGFAVTDF